jgi:hypothetical protein
MKHYIQAKLSFVCGPIGISLMLLSYFIVTPFDLLFRLGLSLIMFGIFTLIWAMIKEAKAPLKSEDKLHGVDK